MIIRRIYPSGFVRTFTVTGAQWANAEKTAAVMFTKESGAVLTGTEQPDVWAQLIQSDIKFKDAPEPPKVSDEELANALIKLDAIDRVKKMSPEDRSRLMEHV